jgi:ATP-dependent helicase/nuclease subunit A
MSKNRAGGPWAALDPFLLDALPEPPPTLASARTDPAGARSLRDELESARRRRTASRERCSAPSYSVAPVTRLAHREAPLPAWRRTGRGMSWGRVLHGLLEALMKDSRLDVRGYAANLLAEEERPPEDLEEAVRWVEGVHASPIWQRALLATRRLVEVPFALTVPRAELGLTEGPPQTLLTGAIDLAFEEAAGWSIVDYKSDTVVDNLPDLVRFYRPQVELYRRYWQQLTGQMTRAGLFFLQTGREEWLDESSTGSSTV